MATVRILGLPAFTDVDADSLQAILAILDAARGEDQIEVTPGEAMTRLVALGEIDIVDGPRLVLSDGYVANADTGESVALTFYSAGKIKITVP